MISNNRLSQDDKRNETYGAYLESCRNGKATINDIISLGTKLMRKQHLHHHFFGRCHFLFGYSLSETSKYLTQHALKNRKSDSDKLTEQEAMDVIALFERRIAERIPVEYITNEADYAGHKFYVNEHVLVPRSSISARFGDFLNDMHWENHRVLDLCTGSGCIGITLALLNPDIQVDLADISPEALNVARINIEKHSLGNRVKCIQTDCFKNIQGKYDLIITNPPYISSHEYKKCSDEFKNEPKIALESGADGLDIINVILSQAKSHLNPNGVLIAEVGYSSAKRIKKKYPKVRFEWIKYRAPNKKESIFDDPCAFLWRYDNNVNL